MHTFIVYNNQLLVLAQNDGERELVRCAAFQALGLSTTSAAKRHFGFENLLECILLKSRNSSKRQKSSALKGDAICWSYPKWWYIYFDQANSCEDDSCDESPIEELEEESISLLILSTLPCEELLLVYKSPCLTGLKYSKESWRRHGTSKGTQLDF